MASEHLTEQLPVPATVPAPVPDWAAVAAPRGDPPSRAAPELARLPVNEDLLAVVAGLSPGKALELGCGAGGNSIWLALRGWIVNAIDASGSAIAEARELAAAEGVGASILFGVADPSAWRPRSRYDLVFCTFALPARGSGRSRMLEMAADAVAGGGTILLSELDVSLRREGVPEKYLASTEELERYLGGFRIERSTVRMARHRQGFEERRLPSATVVATRRTDLRTL